MSFPKLRAICVASALALALISTSSSTFAQNEGRQKGVFRIGEHSQGDPKVTRTIVSNQTAHCYRIYADDDSRFLVLWYDAKGVEQESLLESSETIDIESKIIKIENYRENPNSDYDSANGSYEMLA